MRVSHGSVPTCHWLSRSGARFANQSQKGVQQTVQKLDQWPKGLMCCDILENFDNSILFKFHSLDQFENMFFLFVI